jgi:hypothetical protein
MRRFAALRRAHALQIWLAGSLSLLLPGCGRVGLELLPLDLNPVNDGGGGDPPDDDGGGDVTDAGGDPLMDAAEPMDGTVAMDDAGGTLDADDGALPDGSGVLEAGPDPDAGPPPCPTLCANTNGTASCATGSCVLACALGYADCDGDPGNGCEASTATDSMTCGSCTLACSNPNGGASCAQGLCSASCNPGYGDCDSDATNGCETSLASVTSCGACAAPCSNTHGTTSCPAGTCVPSCATGYADCDGNPANGCETDLNNDPAHCGSCARACGTNGQMCTAGTCVASPCATGRAECDGDLSVTCETNTTNSLSNCGFCGNVCSAAHGTPVCTASSCAVQSCNAGYGNCDTNPTNGCEVTLATSTANCGSCGTACTNAHGTTSCAASACVPSCSTGYGDCDSSRQNGCETGLDTISNCGSCGRTCPANGGTATCSAGVCGTVCDFSGTYALKLTLASTWSSGSVIASGSGTFNFWMKVQATQAGNSLAVSVTECGRYIPPFRASLVSETFLYGYPNSLFDGNFLPSSATTATLGNSSPTASFALPRMATQMGVNMADPINGSWPSTAAGIAAGIRVDMDGDGKPGVTAEYANGGSYIYPRTSSSLFGYNRADNPYVASRVSFSLSGSMSSCTAGSGTASFTHVDTRIFACNRASSTTDCTAAEADFLDTNCLNYALGSASYSLLKVANGASCSTIRAALP